MLKLGKNNIKYLASGPDLVDGCKGLLGRLSTLDDDARSTAMQAAKMKCGSRAGMDSAVMEKFGLGGSVATESDIEKRVRMKSAGLRMPNKKYEQITLFRENFNNFYNGPKLKVVTEEDVKAGKPIGLTQS